MGAPLYYDRIEDLLLPVLLRFADVGLVAQLGHLQYLDKAAIQHHFRFSVKSENKRNYCHKICGDSSYLCTN